MNVHEGTTQSVLLAWRIARRTCHIGAIVTQPPVLTSTSETSARPRSYEIWHVEDKHINVLNADPSRCGMSQCGILVAQFPCAFLHRGWRRIDIAPRPTSAMDIYHLDMAILLAWDECCSLDNWRNLCSFDAVRNARKVVAQHQPRPIRTRHPPASSNSCNAVYFTFFLFASRAL